MTDKHAKLLVSYSQGTSNLGKVKNQQQSLTTFRKLFEVAPKTPETRAQFNKMDKAGQDALKSAFGFIMTAPMKDGVRKRVNVQPRNIISIDVDYATPGLLLRLEEGLHPVCQYEFVLHTSRRHTAKNPRFRIFFILDRYVDVDEFMALSRLLGSMIEDGAHMMKMVDAVSFRPAQMMFKPSICSDGEYVYVANHGDLVDPDAIFAEYPNWTDYSSLPRTETEGDGILRASAAKAEDPKAKDGPVGTFCRAYNVIEAIDEFLPDVYAATDEASEKPRYSYLLGTSTSGAVIEDDGDFLYSHHGSDPCADRLVNAFDLVRIHKFGDLDADEDADTPPGKLPSWKAMLKFCKGDKRFLAQQREDKYGNLGSAFDDVEEVEADEEESEPEVGIPMSDDFDDDDLIGPSPARFPLGSGSHVNVPKSKKLSKRDPHWFERLDTNNNGDLESSATNAASILYNDPRTFRAIAFNAFSHHIVCLHNIITGIEVAPNHIVQKPDVGDPWQDIDDITVRMLLERRPKPDSDDDEDKRLGGYGLKMTDRDMNAAVMSVARRNAFDPVLDMLAEAEAIWDGVPRIDLLWIDYFKVDDNAYHRETARLFMIALVTRQFEPGHKFDYAPIIEGKTGVRKSAFAKALVGDRFFGEIACKLDDVKQVVETIAGVIVGEIPELSSLHKTDHNAAKAFMRRQVDKVRMSYDRRVTERARRMVCIGTTNDSKYLRDPTGNRSYWPIVIILDRLPKDNEGLPIIDTDTLSSLRMQLLGEAVHAYRQMRREKPESKGDLPLTLQTKAAREMAEMLQAEARTLELHEYWLEVIEDWLNKPVTLRQLMTENNFSEDEIHAKTLDWVSDLLVLRVAFTPQQVAKHALGKDHGISDYQTAQNIGKALPLIEGWTSTRSGKSKKNNFRVGGKSGRWLHRDDMTKDEQRLGYRVALVTTDDDDLI